MMEKKKSIKTNGFLISLSIVAIIFMSIGYAAIESVIFNINGLALASPQEGIFITDVVYDSSINATPANSIIKSFYQTTLNSSIMLSNTNSDSSITYSITVYNSYNDTYYFNKVDYLIDETTYSNQDIVFELQGLNFDDALNSKESKTFKIKFYYKDNILPDNNTLISYLNFVFKKKHSITYENLNNTSSYPTYIYDGEDLNIDLTGSAMTDVNVYSNGNLVTDYTYENYILTIPNVTFDLIIYGIRTTDVDVPITDDTNNLPIIDSTSSGEQISINKLFEIGFAGVNGSKKIINRIDVTYTYTSGSFLSSRMSAILTHNGVENSKNVTFNRNVTNGTVVATFDNLAINPNDAFYISNNNSFVLNRVQISSVEMTVYFEE